MNALAPEARRRLASNPLVLTFERPEWLALRLRVILLGDAPWFLGGDVLSLLGRPQGTHGATYSRAPSAHRRKVSRKRAGLAGSGPAEAVVLSLPGVRRMIALAARASAGGPGPADTFEAVLREVVLPAVEAAMGVAGFWAGSPVPEVEESTEAKLARLARIDREYLSVGSYIRAREFAVTAAESRDLGRWCASHCRVERIVATRSVIGAGEYPRRVLDAGARALGWAMPT